jgi:hypothetical protein
MVVLTFKQFLDLYEGSASLEAEYSTLKAVYKLLGDFVGTIQDIKHLTFKIVHDKKEVILYKLKQAKTITFEKIEHVMNGHVSEFIHTLKRHGASQIDLPVGPDLHLTNKKGHSDFQMSKETEQHVKNILNKKADYHSEVL